MILRLFLVALLPLVQSAEPVVACYTEEFAQLRVREKDEKNKPTLLVCITGPNPHWSRLVSFDGNMRKFAESAAAYLKKTELQGIDLDWEFPYWSAEGATWDYDGFARLLEIIHDTFAPQGLLLTAAVSGPPTITRVAYNVTALNKFADLVFVMNYDFHVWAPSVPFVGFNAPLHALPTERTELREMNSEASMRTYLKMGLDRKKAIFGMPVYNLAFILANGKFHVPYAFADDITYDYTSHDLTEDSVRAKAGYAREQEFGGIMIFSLGTDDVAGDCGDTVFPLTSLAAKTLTKN